MPLTLITGPANSEKAGAVLDPFRAAIDRGAILVVPTLADVDRLRRTFAEEGLIFGVRIEQFGGLLETIARQTLSGVRPLGDVARRQVLRTVIDAAPLDALRSSAATPGFVRALAALIDELRGERVSPARWTQVLTTLAEDSPADPQRHATLRELGVLYRAYCQALDRAGRTDRAGLQAAALDALQREPARWGSAPVFVSGFDDLTPVQVQTLDALRRATDVTVSLPFEAGRHAFAARGDLAHRLQAVADQVRTLPANAEHYAPDSRDALHHLERTLLEEQPATLFSPVQAGSAVRLLEGGGERAELELVANEVRCLIDQGDVAPEDIAVVARNIDEVAPLIEQVFAARDVPVRMDRRVRFSQVPFGQALLGLLRAATDEGTAADLLAWLRAPGVVRTAGAIDAFERDLRQNGARTAADARASFEQRWFPLDTIDRLRKAASTSPRALCDAIADAGAALLAAPHQDPDRPPGAPIVGTAPMLSPAEEIDALAWAVARRALDELAGGADRIDGAALTVQHVLGELASADVRVRSGPVNGVAVSDPLRVRARRVRVLCLARLQEGVFPQVAPAPPVLDLEDRRQIAALTGLALSVGTDEAAAEDHLFYAVASRPEQSLVLSWHTADDAGRPVARSPYVDAVTSLFGDTLAASVVRRPLGAVGWSDADQAREAARFAAARAPRLAEAPLGPIDDPAALAQLRERTEFSASELETWAACPVRWFVTRGLRADDLEATPEALVRGQLAHAALEALVDAAHGDGAPAGLTTARLDGVRAQVRAALAEQMRTTPLSTDPARVAVLARRLERDLMRYVEQAVRDDPQFIPAHAELPFGVDGAPPVRLRDDVSLRGRLDRVDLDHAGKRAVVYDYKGATAYPFEKWAEQGRFQMAIYALAARELLGARVVAGLYQPLSGDKLAPRGLVLEDEEPGPPTAKTDRVTDERFAEVMTEVVDAALRAVDELRAGALRPNPERCGVGASKGCQYPVLCRIDGGAGR